MRPFRPRTRLRDLIDIQIRGVGGENRARLDESAEFGKHRSLDFKVLECCFDDDIGVFEAACSQAELGSSLTGSASRPLRFVLSYHGATVDRLNRVVDAASASCFASFRRTGIPAFAKHMAMPRPIVPAPATAAA